MKLGTRPGRSPPTSPPAEEGGIGYGEAQMRMRSSPPRRAHPSLPPQMIQPPWQASDALTLLNPHLERPEYAPVVPIFERADKPARPRSAQPSCGRAQHASHQHSAPQRDRQQQPQRLQQPSQPPAAAAAEMANLHAPRPNATVGVRVGVSPPGDRILEQMRSAPTLEERLAATGLFSADDLASALGGGAGHF